MEHFKHIKILCIALLTIFYLEISNYSFIRNYLLSESDVISRLINSEYGVSQKLKDYLKDKDYQFVYDENNQEYEGNIISYVLIKEIDSLFIDTKEIKISKSLILGSFI